LVRGKGYTRRGTNKSVNEPKNRTHCVCLSKNAEIVIRKLMNVGIIKKNGISNLISSALIKTYGESSTMELCKSMVIEEQIKADEHRSRAELWANELDKQINELREGVKV